MKKVIVRIDDNGNMIDENGSIIVCVSAMNYNLAEYDESASSIDAAKLLGLGATPDDLIKLKAAGVI